VRIPLVIASAPALPGDAGVGALRASQRAALEQACLLADVPVPCAFPRDAADAPAPFAGGWHWSAANTTGAAVAAVAPCALGVDVEALARPRVAPVTAFADANEIACAPDGAEWDARRTLELWCAKEAVLKLALIGIAELRACRLVDAPRWRGEGETLVLEHRGRLRSVVLREHDGFVLALCSAEPATVEVARAEVSR
jgi:hypothetical protein